MNSSTTEQFNRLVNIIIEENKSAREETGAEYRLAINESRARAIEWEVRTFLNLAKVTAYNGQNSPKTIEKFIDDVKRISEGFKLLNQQLITIAGRNMKGMAERWFLSYREQKLNQEDTFEDFTDKLRKQFIKGYDVQAVFNKLISCVQSGSVEQYNTKFNKILLELPRDFLGEQVKLTIYINNLRSQIKPHVKVQQPSTLSGAIEYALLFETQYTELSWWEKKSPLQKNSYKKSQDSDEMEIVKKKK